jgi:mycoredoxin
MAPGYDVSMDGALPCDLFEGIYRLMLTMYSTSWCGYCHRLKSQLDREGISYDVVDIEQEPAAAEFVMSVNRGNRTVPTLRFDDGSALTNPSIVQVKDHLAAITA